MPRRAGVDWLAEGRRLLERHGPAALTLESLTTAGGRTKGSFYHHFRSFAAFRRALLGAWRREHTEALIERADREPSSAARRAAIDRLALQVDFARELAMRRWAGVDAEARRAVEAVDRRRIAYLAGLPTGAGRAADLALAEYALYLGLQQLGPAQAARLRAIGPELRIHLAPRGAARRRRKPPAS